LAFGQNSESVVEICYVVLGLDFVKVVRFETLKLDGWVISGDVVSLGGGVDFVEESVEDAWGGLESVDSEASLGSGEDIFILPTDRVDEHFLYE
jgi:hypothetical protein